jgi:excisionase family DNA binding protein
MSEELVSLDEICKVLSVDHVQVYKWMSTRKLPAHLVGGVWKFDRNDVEQWFGTSGVKDEEPDGNS